MSPNVNNIALQAYKLMKKLTAFGLNIELLIIRKTVFLIVKISQLKFFTLITIIFSEKQKILVVQSMFAFCILKTICYKLRIIIKLSFNRNTMGLKFFYIFLL